MLSHLRYHARTVVGLAALLTLWTLAVLPSSVIAQPGPRRSEPRGRGGFGTFGTAGLLDQVRRGDVQTELKLTPEQIEKLQDLAENGPRLNFAEGISRIQEASPEQRTAIREEALAKREEARKAQDAKVKEILSPSQLTRAEQLVLQRLGPPALSRSEVAEKIGLSEEQKKQVASIFQTADQKLRELGFRAPREEGDKVTADRNSKLLELLSADQKKTWEASLGKPFETVPARGVGGRGVSTNSPRAAGAGMISRSGPQGLLQQVRRAQVQTELKLTPEQLEKLHDLAENGPRLNVVEMIVRIQEAPSEQRTAIREEALAKREEVRKAQDAKVKEILSPEQLTRAEQLVLQELGPSALNRDEVAEKIGLSEWQKKQVASIIQIAAEKNAALGFRGPQEERAKITSGRDAELLKLLSADQKKTWEASLGTPFEALADRTAGGTGFRRAQRSSNSAPTAAPGSSGRLASRASGNSLGLLEEIRREHVQTELKLTPEQIQKVNDLVENGPRADFSEFFARLREATPEQQASIREEMYAKREESRKTLDSKVKEILSPEQLLRAEQLVLQDLGLPALNRSEVAQKVGLSKEQQNRVASIIQTADQKMRELGFRGSREERAKITSDQDAELLELLSEEQKKNWEGSLGEPRQVRPPR